MTLNQILSPENALESKGPQMNIKLNIAPLSNKESTQEEHVAPRHEVDETPVRDINEMGGKRHD